MQRGLIDHRTGKKRFAVLFQRDCQAPKPVFPIVAQMALYPDLIDGWFTWICFYVEFVCQFSVPFLAGYYSPCHLLNVKVIYR